MRCQKLILIELILQIMIEHKFKANNKL